MRMFTKVEKLIMAVGALCAVAVGSAVIANAASNGTTAQQGTQSQGAQTQAPQPRQNESPLTGDTATKVEQAALAKVSGGTVLRVETDADGSAYEAHVRKSDSTEVVVKVNKAFEVTAVDEAGAFGGHGRGPGGPGGGETPLTGDTATKVEQAARDKVSGGTVLRVETDADGSPYEAHVRKSDGTEVVVKENKNFDVTAVEQFGGQRRGG
jgi:uncharacterized membrane protein YkoI